MSSTHTTAPLSRAGLPWHQRAAQTLTFGALSSLLLLGPSTAAGYLIQILGF